MSVDNPMWGGGKYKPNRLAVVVGVSISQEGGVGRWVFWWGVARGGVL